MYKILLLTLLLNCFLVANDEDTIQTPSYDEQIQLLHTIQNEAIVYGFGVQKVHVFIDPWCRYSRQFISMISKNKKMLSKYRYYLYLYSIPRLHSQNAIAAVYSANEPLEILLKIMLNDDKRVVAVNKQTQLKVDAITDIAKKVHVTKRPFLLIEK